MVSTSSCPWSTRSCARWQVASWRPRVGIIPCRPPHLINEAYLRLADQEYHSWENRRQFLLVASTVMRRVLVDYARRRSAAKRPDGHHRVAIETDDLGEEFGTDLIVLDQVLEQLAEVDQRQAQIVEACAISPV